MQHGAYQLRALNIISVSSNADVTGESHTVMIRFSNHSFCCYDNTVACWNKPTASVEGGS